MKKVLLGFLGLLLLSQGIKAQPVSDNAVIPMAITVNSILRLSVVDGGNIEFVFNTLNDINTGLSGARYSTSVTVASSSNWDLSVLATTDAFYDDGGNDIPLSHVCFNLTNTTTAGANTIGIDNTFNSIYAANGVASAITAYNTLTDTPPVINVLTPGSGNAGDIVANAFTFNWECGVTANCGAGSSMIGEPSGRYATSILLSLSAQ